jgi:hypothetical protein
VTDDDGTAVPHLARALHLEAHPEGGWFRQTWRTATTLRPPTHPGERVSATGILYVLGPGEESMWHRVRSDELWLWHRGVSLSLWIDEGPDAPGDDARRVRLGPRVEDGEHPQVLVPGGAWQCARPDPGGEVLVSCVVSPGFEFDDFTTL